jgi:FKBP-type peptidyl-prolyl cis-trans isomerase FkpA
MKNLYLLLMGSVIIVLLFLQVNCRRKPQFAETDTGLKYLFHQQHKDSLKVELYDLVEVLMNYRTVDSALFQSGLHPISFQVDPIAEGDLLEGMMLMRKGDSATFIISPEKFFKNMMQYNELPDHVKGEEQLFFDIKLVDIKPEPVMLRADRLETRARKTEEPSKIRRYLSENDVRVEPLPSGLYFIELIKGEGKKVADGKKVKVHFRGLFLDGRVFDSSYDREQPVTFIQGKGEVIPAWEEGIAKMGVGDKARLIVPSALAYGDQQRNNIKPHTPLIFEIEVLEVKD